MKWICKYCDFPCIVESETSPTKCLESREHCKWNELVEENEELVTTKERATKFWNEVIQNDTYEYTMYVERYDDETERNEIVRLISTPTFKYSLDKYYVVCSSNIFRLHEKEVV